MKQTRLRDNYLGAGGWVWGGNYKGERYLYILHRVTGLGIMLFVIMHLIATTIFRVQGQTVWESTMSTLDKPWFKFGEYLVVLAFLFHGINGLRLTIQELGFALGKPTPPVYPWKDALRKNRSWAVAVVVLVAIIAAVFLYDFIAP